ncbi:uncharacterized protein LOC119975158 [Scyliorhinus canicula]|uniref:uncharacterized protein LOC119975158 n=1 Tax=Scyliorhinus canicula TaxID=7830 RepID=UPI0018F52B64|nr:uncharacterized protein LOC119975158 [Scyliorhinus canicula]
MVRKTARKWTTQLGGKSQATATQKSGKGKMKRVKRKFKSKTDLKPPSHSLLLYDPQVALQELKSRHPPVQKEVGLTNITMQIASYQSSRKKYNLIQSRLALSKQVSRFKLPVDMRLLEALSPQGYIMKYCSICKRRQALYKRSFDKFDRSRNGILSFQEMEKALIDLYCNTITSQHISQVTDILLVDESTKITYKLFFPLCALSERLLYNVFETNDRQHDEHREKYKVEEADFSGLKWKFQSCHLSDEMKKLIYLL